MRLRRETGDFYIALNAQGTYTARPNLPAENFLGEIVKTNDGVMTVVTVVTPTETGATLVAGELTLTYVKETGVVALEAEGASGATSA